VLEHKPHAGMKKLITDLNYLYRSRPALHARDCEPEGFEWLIADDRENSVFAWLRKAPGENPVAVISNFTPVQRDFYEVPLPEGGRWREIFNSDADIYGGAGNGNGGFIQAEERGGRFVGKMMLPALSTIMLECVVD
jgi:1,4-alpha-glucan branching enzyme